MLALPVVQAETSSQQMAALQRRHERMQRLEHDFVEERRMREANKGTMEMELVQQRRPEENTGKVDGGLGRLMGWWLGGRSEVIDSMVVVCGVKLLNSVMMVARDFYGSLKPTPNEHILTNTMPRMVYKLPTSTNYIIVITWMVHDRSGGRPVWG